MIDIFWVLPLAVVLGMLVGMLPGMSSVLGMILIMPVIGHLPITVILIFFACYLCVVQYYGSVSALLLRVPGETSSLPVLIASQGLHGRSIIKAMRLTALTSLVASIIGVAVFSMVFLIDRTVWTGFFGTRFLAIFLLLVFVLLIVHGRWWLNAVLILLALLISNLQEIPLMIQACSQHLWSCWILQPADITLILLGIYSVPLLFVPAQNAGHGARVHAGYPVNWKSLWPYRWLSVKHGLLGTVIGFMPGMGVTLASNVSARLESLHNNRNRLAIMGAAEASNNSATVSSTMPWLFLGLPITASELYLDNWLSVFRNIQVNFEIFYRDIHLAFGTVPYFMIFIACVLLTNFLAFYLSSRFVKLYQCISRIPPSYINLMVKCSILAAIVSVLWLLDLDPVSAAVTLGLSSLVGIWAHRRGVDVIALPIALVVGKTTFEVFSKIYYLYFQGVIL